jgi:hypothetical protein
MNGTVNGKPIPEEVTADWTAMESIRCKQVADFIARWPNFRQLAAYGLLVEAIAVCDTFGVNVEDFVAKLRKAEPKLPILLPPRSS